MKNLIVAFALILTTASLAIAKDITFQGCTTDHKQTALTLNINDEAPVATIAEVKAAFAKTASSLSAADLVSEVGFKTFIENLSETAYAVIDEINGPPQITGSCK